MERSVTKTLACFVAGTGFDDLPFDVVHESKRLLLDVVGCALGSVELDKGRLAVQAALKIGGASEATILGSRDKVACLLSIPGHPGGLVHTLR